MHCRSVFSGAFGNPLLFSLTKKRSLQERTEVEEEEVVDPDGHQETAASATAAAREDRIQIRHDGRERQESSGGHQSRRRRSLRREKRGEAETDR